MKKFLFFLLFVISLKSAATDIKPTGARQTGMANACVMWSNIGSTFHNQAGLAGIKSFSFCCDYINGFGIKELSLKSAAFLFPINAGTFGLSYTQFGYSQYNESKTGLAYSMNLGKYLRAGIQLDYMRAHIAENYGNDGAAVAELGIQTVPFKNFSLGFHVFNPTQSQWNNFNKEKIESIYRFGIGYSIAEKACFSLETEQDLHNKTIFKVGTELQLVKNLFIRAGIATQPQLNSFGIGYSIKGITMDIAFTHHPILGYSSAFSLNFQMEKRKKN